MDPLNQNQFNHIQSESNSSNSSNSLNSSDSSNKTLFLAVIVSSLTVLGIIAGINLIIGSSSQPTQSTQLAQSTKSTQPTQQQQQTPQQSDDKNIPKMVTQGSFINTATSSVSNKSPVSDNIDPDKLTTGIYLVGNLKTGKIYLSSNINKILPVASISKLITAIVATDRFTSTTTIGITSANVEVATDTSAIGVGEKFTLKEILYPLLLNSSNIAAEAIASTDISSSTGTSTSILTSNSTGTSTARSTFLSDMFSTAQEIGMLHTSFTDPSGLDSGDQSSAKDIFTLAKYLYSFRPDMLAMTRVVNYYVATTTDHGSHSFGSIHPFINDPRFIGGKTGRTLAAGETMLTILNIGDKPIAFIVLHSDLGARAKDTSLLVKKYLAL